MRDIDLPELFEANRKWAASMTAAQPTFFTDLEHEQRPAYLWIGCSDSRVPANQIVGLPPGGVFVHRNIGNLVVHTDLNCLSVLQYAVDVLGVRHVIVTGHYGCGAIAAALDGASLGLIDNWLRHIQDIAGEHAEDLAGRADPADRVEPPVRAERRGPGVERVSHDGRAGRLEARAGARGARLDLPPRRRPPPRPRRHDNGRHAGVRFARPGQFQRMQH